MKCPGVIDEALLLDMCIGSWKMCVVTLVLKFQHNTQGYNSYTPRVTNMNASMVTNMCV